MSDFASMPREKTRCDGCAAPFAHYDADGQWCSSCMAPRLRARIAELERLIAEPCAECGHIDWREEP